MRFKNAVKLIKFWEENNMQKVTFEGYEYTLTQEPYIDGVSGETPYYTATAVDADGEQHQVIWDVVDEWGEIEDESDMVADWDAPTSVL